MALILNIETATEICSVTLARDGQIITSLKTADPKAHASGLTLLIDDVIARSELDYNDLDAIAVSKGPGSYTGLRIGVSTAKGLCFALNKPMISVDTLQSFASHCKVHLLNKEDANLSGNELFCPMIDARRMEVYTAIFDYELNIVEPVQALILKTDSFHELSKSKRIYFFGNGATKWQELAHTNDNMSIVEGLEISANGMAKWSESKFNLNDFEDIAYFEPFYLKDFITANARMKS